MTATNICYNFVGFRCSPPRFCQEGVEGEGKVAPEQGILEINT